VVQKHPRVLETFCAAVCRQHPGDISGSVLFCCAWFGLVCRRLDIFILMSSFSPLKLLQVTLILRLHHLKVGSRLSRGYYVLLPYARASVFASDTIFMFPPVSIDRFFGFAKLLLLVHFELISSGVKGQMSRSHHDQILSETTCFREFSRIHGWIFAKLLSLVHLVTKMN